MGLIAAGAGATTTNYLSSSELFANILASQTEEVKIVEEKDNSDNFDFGDEDFDDSGADEDIFGDEESSTPAAKPTTGTVQEISTTPVPTTPTPIKVTTPTRRVTPTTQTYKPKATTKPTGISAASTDPINQTTDNLASELTQALQLITQSRPVADSPNPVSLDDGKGYSDHRTENMVSALIKDGSSILLEDLPENINPIIEKNISLLVSKDIENYSTGYDKTAKVTEKIPVFKDYLKNQPESSTSIRFADNNLNGIPDGLEQDLKLNTTSVDQTDISQEAKMAIQAAQLISHGEGGATDVSKKIQLERKKFRATRTREMINEVSKTLYNTEIVGIDTDSNNDGISDEVSILFGIDPNESNTNALLRLYGAKESNNSETPNCTTDLMPADNLSANGFAVLARCQTNGEYTMFAIDENGRESELATNLTDNNNLVFNVVNSNDVLLKSGKYILVLRTSDYEESSKTEEPEVATPKDASEPVYVEISDDNKIDSPVIKKIGNLDGEDVEVSDEVNAVKNLQLSIDGESGRIVVKGIADIESVVKGAFQSAIYSSAILADTESGGFTIVSPRPLDLGNHEVVIYASKQQENARSKPISLRFSINKLLGEDKILIEEESQRPSASETKSVEGTSESEEKNTSKLPILPIAGGIVLLGAGVAVLHIRKNRGAQMESLNNVSMPTNEPELPSYNIPPENPTTEDNLPTQTQPPTTQE